MLKRAGFTIVEIVIVMVIMAILLTLTVVNLTSSQANARDEARKADMEALARGLEGRYKSGNARASLPAGSYPSTQEMKHIMAKSSTITPAASSPYPADALPGTTIATLTSPNATAIDLTLIGAQCIIGGPGDVLSTITSTNAGCMGTTGKYNIFYTSTTDTGDICNNTTDTCVRYTLYCRMEKDDSLMTIRSQRQ